MAAKTPKALHLLQPPPSKATVEELETLLVEARAGRVIGIAYIAISSQSYHVNSVGQANSRPILTRGMIRVLDDLLRERT